MNRDIDKAYFYQVGDGKYFTKCKRYVGKVSVGFYIRG